MSLSKQILIALVLLLPVGAGAIWHFRSERDAVAEAAVGRGPEAVPVEIEQAEAGIARERIEAVGTTLARQSIDVIPLASGRVVAISFSSGERVAAGQILVQLDDEAEQAAVDEAGAALREADLALERARKLVANNTIARATVDELEAAHVGARARLHQAEKQLAERTVRAPFAGVVGLRGVDVGARVDDTTVLATLDDLAEIEIEFAVPEIFYGAVRPGQVVSASSAAFRGRRFEGRVSTIDSRIDEVARAFRVRARLPNPDLTLPAGMFMHVELILEERPAVMIPEGAVLAEGSSTFVFTIAEGRAERREVRLGRRELGRVEVLGGLDAGDPVVAGGLQRLREGLPVEILNGGDPDAAPRPADAGV